jgi:hypothetical protein
VVAPCACKAGPPGVTSTERPLNDHMEVAMRPSDRVLARTREKITDHPDLSITACRRADLVATTVVDVSMAIVTIVVLTMIVALFLMPVG